MLHFRFIFINYQAWKKPKPNTKLIITEISKPAREWIELKLRFVRNWRTSVCPVYWGPCSWWSHSWSAGSSSDSWVQERHGHTGQTKPRKGSGRWLRHKSSSLMSKAFNPKSKIFVWLYSNQFFCFLSGMLVTLLKKYQTT